MKLRIPAWTQSPTLKVNGRSHAAVPGEFAVVKRRWRSGDTVELVIPQPLRVLPIDAENPQIAALMRGAVMYVGLNPWDGIGDQAIDLPESLERVPGSQQVYRTSAGTRDLVFVPYFTIDTESYNTYFKVAHNELR